jgi:uncharacterized protein YybS (DUF2232 family)
MIVEAGLMVAVFAVLCILARYVPFLAILTLFFAIPFILMYARHNAAITLMTLFASTVVGFIVTQDLMQPILLLSVSGPMALTIGFLMKRKQSTTIIMLVSSLITALGYMCFLQVMVTLFPVPGAPKTVVGYFQWMMQQSTDMIQNMDLPNKAEALKASEAMILSLNYLMPALMIMTGFIFTLINITLAYKIFDRLRMPYKKPNPFADFFIPNEMMLGITGVFAILLVVGLLKVISIQLIIANIMTLFVFIFTIQGVATTYGWLMKKGYKKGMAIGLVVVMFVFNMQLGLALLGWLDLLFDFRKIRKRKTEE